MGRKKIGIAVLMCAALTLIGGSLLADVPSALTYQGKLTDEKGQPVPDGVYTMDFVLHTDATGSNPVWDEHKRTVEVADGLFTVKLGEVNPIPTNALSGPRWLDIRVEGVELSPRIELTTSPYAFQAHVAQHVLESAAVTSLNAVTGPVTLSAGENMSIQQDGNDITFSATTSVPNPLPVSQSGAWNVGVTGTPTVNVSSMPAVSIHSSANEVRTPATHNHVQLFSTSRTIAPGESVMSSLIDCTGFRELRGALRTTMPSENVRVSLSVRSGTGDYYSIGYFNFGTPSESIATTGNFTQQGGWCLFTIPLMSDRVRITITNNSASTATIFSYSYVYLIN